MPWPSGIKEVIVVYCSVNRYLFCILDTDSSFRATHRRTDRKVEQVSATKEKACGHGQRIDTQV